MSIGSGGGAGGCERENDVDTCKVGGRCASSSVNGEMGGSSSPTESGGGDEGRITALPVSPSKSSSSRPKLRKGVAESGGSKGFSAIGGIGRDAVA